MPIILTCIVLFLVNFLPILDIRADEEPTQMWNSATIRFIQPKPLGLETFIHGRFTSRYDDVALYQITTRGLGRINKNLSTAIAYSYFGVRQNSLGEEGLTNQHRYEFEINPEFEIAPALQYRSRNRYEYLQDESFTKISSRFRHRSLLEYTNPFNLRVRSLYTSLENFYLLSTREWNQFRYVPIGVRFDLSKDFVLSLFPMIQYNKLQDDSWSRRPVVGLEFNYQF
jgi:hypothetical protein